MTRVVIFAAVILAVAIVIAVLLLRRAEGDTGIGLVVGGQLLQRVSIPELLRR